MKKNIYVSAAPLINKLKEMGADYVAVDQHIEEIFEFSVYYKYENQNYCITKEVSIEDWLKIIDNKSNVFNFFTQILIDIKNNINERECLYDSKNENI